MTKVLVTGASGFIGSHVVPLLQARGHEVHAVSRRQAPNEELKVVWHRADLLAPGAARALIADIGPHAVLHLAWCADPPNYLTSPDNQRWLEVTEELIESFFGSSGGRFVGAGTVLEYDLSGEVCDERTTPAAPDTPYGEAKKKAGSFLQGTSDSRDRSWAWARIFHPYGPGEPREKLVSHVALHVFRGQRVPLSGGEQIRDYVYIDDVARGLVLLVEEEASGVFNIGSGAGVSVRAVAQTVADVLGRPDLLGFGDLEGADARHPRMIAATQRLRSLGWEPKTDLRTGIERTVESVR